MSAYWFTSDLFEIVAGEDEQTNPGIYGKALAGWLRGRLLELGYGVEEVIPEDWGWLVLCARDPYLLGVGCASVTDVEGVDPGDSPPAANAVIWHCRTFVEVPFFKRIFQGIDTKPGVAKLEAELAELFANEPRIQLTEAP
jgi:hypothetical protein